MYTEHVPPSDTEAERALIGSLLIDNDAIGKIIDRLRAEDFYNRNNGTIYTSVVSLYERGIDISQVTVADELSRRRALKDVGGLPTLAKMIADTPTSVYAGSYVEVVRKKSIQRQLIHGGAKITEVGFKGEESSDGMLDRADQIVTGMHRERATRAVAHVETATLRYLDNSPRDGRKTGIHTGYPSLDHVIGGMHGGNLIILAASTGGGKSAFATNIARNVAHQLDVNGKPRPVLFFSFEMGESENVARLLSQISGVSLRTVLNGPWTEETEILIQEAAGKLAQEPIHLADTKARTVAGIRSEARLLQRERGLGLVVVDYLQLVSATDAKRSRVEQVTEVTRGLKSLAMELDVPVIALAQLNREFHQRNSKEPVLSDLRESGSIEQDADKVLFLYRPELYFSESDWLASNTGVEYPHRVADVIVAKHRNGPLGRVSLRFEDFTTRFSEVDA